jgi:hypothetical protein
MATISTLSSRGDELFVAGGHLEKVKAIWGNPYHPETNTDGFVNMGTSENVGSHISCLR